MKSNYCQTFLRQFLKKQDFIKDIFHLGATLLDPR